MRGRRGWGKRRWGSTRRGRKRMRGRRGWGKRDRKEEKEKMEVRDHVETYKE